MECKICHTEMACQPRMDLTYYECSSCGGLWFNSGELESLIASKIPLPLDQGDEFAPASGDRISDECPHCGPESVWRR
ncbi:MAG TPA: zf-TFIIB domain-containing protein [Sumerlaeia bacterium]|nr:zf-TFIIB domain-containing protein [Sumerlaeia bacterium]